MWTLFTFCRKKLIFSRNNMGKKSIIAAILVIGGIAVFSFSLNEKNEFTGEKIQTGESVLEETFILSGIVFGVDPNNNFLMVRSSGKESEIKVILSGIVKLIKLESPFPPENPPPPGTQFTPEQTEVSLREVKEGDGVFIKAKENIAGKTEFSDIEFIQILP